MVSDNCQASLQCLLPEAIMNVIKLSIVPIDNRLWIIDMVIGFHKSLMWYYWWSNFDGNIPGFIFILRDI